MRRYMGYAIAVILVLSFMYFVYPTRYIYLNSTLGGQQMWTPVRVDRLTGEAQILKRGGWQIFGND